MKKLTIAVLLAGTAIAGIPGTASADNDTSAASAGSLCLYQAFNFTSGRACFESGDSDLSNNQYTNGYNVDNRTSSVTNATCKDWVLYDGPGGTGGHYPVFVNERINLWDWDNKASSFYVQSTHC
ncbi:peptidase inhibitor family I36 protein [Nonomuraea sp. KM88]|uniref:peptidase inhibitor family I36 protein n=1 Tax=Nonomuraea sp. KM88 TaxID=3457427 RepID=UPI003FCCC989